MDYEWLDFMVSVNDRVKATDTSDWLPMEIRNLSRTVGLNKEKTALYILTDGEWIRSVELYVEKSYQETFN